MLIFFALSIFSIQHFIQIMYIYMFLYTLCHCCHHLVEWNGMVNGKMKMGKLSFSPFLLLLYYLVLLISIAFNSMYYHSFIIIIISISIGIISFSIMCLKEMLKHLISLFFIIYDYVLLLEAPSHLWVFLVSNCCCYGCCATNAQERLE